MHEARRQFIDAAVRPLEDRMESKRATAQWLDELIPLEPAGAEEATRRWEEVDQSSSRRPWRKMFFYLCLVISLVFWADGLNAWFRHTNLIAPRLMECFYGYPSIGEIDNPDFPSLSGEDRWLLFGDTSRQLKSDRMKSRWEREPMDSGYFVAYADAYLEEHRQLPPGFLDTARRIDPLNSFFTYVAAGAAAENAVKKPGRPRPKVATKPPDWEIESEPRFNEALSLIRQARDQPEYRNPREDLLKRQVLVLPSETPSERSFSIYYLYDGFASEYNIRHLTQVMAAKAWFCAETGDRAGLEALLADNADLQRKRLSTVVNNLRREHVTVSHVNGLVPHLASAAGRLGMPEVHDQLTGILAETRRIKLLTDARKGSHQSRLLHEQGGSVARGLIHTGTAVRLEFPPELNLDLLTPGRMVDHEIFARYSAYLVWAGLMVCFALVCGYRLQTPKLVGGAVLRVESLLRPSDMAWILAVGVVLPFLYLQVLTRLTPLGGRALSIFRLKIDVPEWGDLPLPLIQWAGFLLLVILLSVLAIRWRLSTRARALDFHRERQWLLIPAILCAAALIPVAGNSAIHPGKGNGYLSLCLFAVPVFWLLAVVSAVLFINSPKLLQHAVVARVLAPCLATAALLAMLAVPFYKSEALRWFDKDTLLRVNPDHPALTDFEHACALQMRKETRALLGYDP